MALGTHWIIVNFCLLTSGREDNSLLVILEPRRPFAPRYYLFFACKYTKQYCQFSSEDMIVKHGLLY